MIKDDCEITSETGPSTRATSVKSKTSTIYLLSSYLMEQLKTYSYLNTYPTIKPTILFLYRPTTSSIILPYNRGKQTVREGNYGVVVTVNSLSVTAATLPSFKQEGQRDLAQDEEEQQEIMKIINKIQTRRGYEYIVYQKSTQISNSELRNVARLVQEFNIQVRGQRRGKRGRPARVEKNRRLVAVSKRR